MIVPRIIGGLSVPGVTLLDSAANSFVVSVAANIDASAVVEASASIGTNISASIDASAVIEASIELAAGAGPGAQFALLEAGTATTLTDAMGLTGVTPDHYVIMTASDGGADKVGTGDIDVSYTSPLFQEPDVTLDIDDTCMDQNVDGVFSTGGTDWDVDVESMAVVYIGSLTQQLTNGGCILSKGTAQSYSLRGRPSGGLGAVLTSSGTVTAAVNIDHWDTASTSPIGALIVNDHDADDFRLHTNKGSSTSQAAKTDSLSHTNPFKFGFSGGLAAGNAGICHGLVAIFTGADAEGLTRTHLTNLMDYLGLDYTP